MIPINPWIR